MLEFYSTNSVILHLLLLNIMPKRNMSTRSSRSSVTSEEAASSSAMTTMTTTSTRNPEVGTPDGASAPHVSSQGADPPQVVIL